MSNKIEDRGPQSMRRKSTATNAAPLPAESESGAQPGIQRRYQEITARIREMLASGALGPGDRLPSERTLAERFRVSRNSVREAIRALAEQGVLESRRGDGTYVREPDGESLAAAFVAGFEAQRHRIAEIFQFRRMIEPPIAALAARHVSSQWLDRLKVLVCDQHQRLLADVDDADLDVAFHLEVARASGNQVVVEALNALHEILAETRSSFLQTRERRSMAIQAHLRIIAALEAHDPEAASEAMRAHLHAVEDAALGEAQSQTQRG
ncbi:MAG: FadR/GntR family transcriptional regulator [Desulfovibrio sp.]|jgi:GntR family transcriptional repressor for pyruvate dehydrogenase complex|nr:FadR/GntR family transcriptional regulator [Desulfovibrio sp.]